MRRARPDWSYCATSRRFHRGRTRRFAGSRAEATGRRRSSATTRERFCSSCSEICSGRRFSTRACSASGAIGNSGRRAGPDLSGHSRRPPAGSWTDSSTSGSRDPARRASASRRAQVDADRIGVSGPDRTLAQDEPAFAATVPVTVTTPTRPNRVPAGPHRRASGVRSRRVRAPGVRDSRSGLSRPAPLDAAEVPPILRQVIVDPATVTMQHRRRRDSALAGGGTLSGGFGLPAELGDPRRCGLTYRCS